MLLKRSRNRKPAKIQGFTLIEVLVTLLVLSLGLVGIAALHLTSLKNAHSSYYTSIASSIALDFEERLWLKVAAKGPGDCIDNTDITDVREALEQIWRSSEADVMSLPGLVLVPDASDPAAENTWREVSLKVSWADARFQDISDGALEEFTYLARVVCWPDTPVGQAGDEENP